MVMRGTAKLPPWVADLMKELMTPPSFMRPSAEDKKEFVRSQSEETVQKSPSSREFGTDAETHVSPQDIKWSKNSLSTVHSRPSNTTDRNNLRSTQSTSSGRVEERTKSATASKDAGGKRNRELDDLGRQSEAVLIQSGIPLRMIPAYGWSIERCAPVANIAKLHTKNGVFALKETHLTPSRIRFLYRLTQYVRQNGFDRIARFAMTEQKKSYFTDDDKVYYATRWIEGSTANFASLTQIGEVAHSLAEFHEASRGFESSGYSPPMEFHLLGITQRRVDDLKALVFEVQQKEPKDQFDLVFLQMAPQLITDADAAVEILSSKECLEFLNKDEDTPGVCHLDVIPGNFIYDGQKHQVHLLDLDLATYAPRVLDAAHLLRRSLQLQNWSPEVAYVCFVRYNAIREFAQEEYKLLHGLLRFPYRAWRLAHTRYRVFEDKSQIEDLISYRNQDIRRQAFLRAFSRELVRED